VDDEGRLYVGARQETSIPGLYAAGDMVRGLNQISVAEGEGSIAAVDVHNALRSGR
jgi:thioredoxin reductase (NADPH)